MTTAYEQKTLTEKILARQTEYEGLRESYDDSFGKIVDYVDLDLTAWKNPEPGKLRGEKLYEGTPAWGLRLMADGWLGSIISETDPWMRYIFADKKLRDNDELNQWVQDVQEQMYSVYRRSEFYSAMAPFTRLGLSVGSPVILPYEDMDERRIKCEVPNPRENYHGPHGAYHRLYEITVLDAVAMFLKGKTLPENKLDAPLSSTILDDYHEGRHTNKHLFIRAVYRRDDPILKKEKVLYRKQPWMEFYVEKNAPDVQQKKEPLKIGGYWTKPHIRWDYDISSDEFYARTPAWHCMMDVFSQQEFAKQLIEAGQESLHPALWVLKKYRNFSMAPKARVSYDTVDEAAGKPEPIESGRDYKIGVDVHEMIRRSVERWFHVDLFQMLLRLPEQKAGWPTATQVLEMKSEKTAILAPRIGRYTAVLREVDTRFFDIERRAGRLPEPPDVLLDYMAEMKAKGEREVHLDLEFLGPLPQVQRRALTLERASLALQIQKEFMAIEPNLVHKTRNSKAFERLLEEIGFWQDCIVPEGEYQEVLAGIAQKQAQDEQSAQLLEAAKVLPKLQGAGVA